MAQGRKEAASRVPASVERFLKQLVITSKAVALYPASSAIPRENAAQAVALLRSVLQKRPDLRFEVAKEGLLYLGKLLFAGQSAFDTFARDFYGHSLAEVRFHSGADVPDILGFLSLLQSPPASVAESGGFEAGLWERQVDAITVTEVEMRVLDASGQDASQAAEEWPPDAGRIEELLLGTFARRGRDHVMLERVLTDERAVRVYLASAAQGQGGAAEVASRLESLAHAVEESAPARRPAMFNAIAQAVLQLEPELRREILRKRMLPEARTDEPVAHVLRQMSIDQVAAVLVEAFAAGEVSQEGLSRAIRNLAQISVAGRDEVVNAVGAAMRDQGMTDDRVAEALSDVTPQRLHVREMRPVSAERPVESIVRLVDLAEADRLAESTDDPAIAALKDEAGRGFTDGDVLVALVALLGLDRREDRFGTVMSVVEEGMGVLLERGEFETAADVGATLTAIQMTDDLDVDQRARIGAAVRTLATPEHMGIINHAFRVFPEGSSEHDACSRLLAVLGGRVLEPMLEVLAREQDMAARKSAVDLMSTMAGSFVDELGARVGDERWFFVRNVVSILGRTHDSAILPYLERTLRHGDARVRRETIRALAGVKDRRAEEMLIAALDDDDAQNVSLAARYLGVASVRGSTEALVQVARGEGRGNRDVGARVEAIEALGRIGDRGAVPALEVLASRRTLLRGRGREVRTAAAAALDAVANAAGTGGAS